MTFSRVKCKWYSSIYGNSARANVKQIWRQKRQRGRKRKKMIAHWTDAARKDEKEEGREKERKIKRERERERSAGFKEPTVVKEPSSSLHLDTHKYKTQPFELTRREGEQCSRFFLLLLFSLLLSLFLSLSLSSALPSSLSHRRSKFISRSCLFWTFHNIWPRYGIQYRRAPVTRRYGFEPSVMDGSLSRLPRTAASTLSLIPFLGFLLYLEDARWRRNPGPLGFERRAHLKSKNCMQSLSQDCLARNADQDFHQRYMFFSNDLFSFEAVINLPTIKLVDASGDFTWLDIRSYRMSRSKRTSAESIVQERRSIVQRAVPGSADPSSRGTVLHRVRAGI